MCGEVTLRLDIHNSLSNLHPPRITTCFGHFGWISYYCGSWGSSIELHRLSNLGGSLFQLLDSLASESILCWAGTCLLRLGTQFQILYFCTTWDKPALFSFLRTLQNAFLFVFSLGYSLLFLVRDGFPEFSHPVGYMMALIHQCHPSQGSPVCIPVLGVVHQDPGLLLPVI